MLSNMKGGKDTKRILLTVLVLIMIVPCISFAQQMTKFTVATVQMAPAHLDKKANVEKMVGFVKEAVNKKAKLIVFPEMIVTGYVGPISPPESAGFYNNAESISGPTTIQMQNLPQEYGV
jgi:predicted amidohydrolase